MSMGPVLATHPAAVTFQVTELLTQKWLLTLPEPRAAHCNKPSHKWDVVAATGDMKLINQFFLSQRQFSDRNHLQWKTTNLR